MTKGPVAVLPLVIVGGYLVATRQLHLIRRVLVWPGVLIAAAIALPWYAWMAWLHGRGFIDFALGYEVVARYGYSSTAFPTSPRSFFWYFQIYPGDAAPWTLFIVAAIGWSLWRLRSFAAETRQAVVFLLIWFFAIVLVFSTAKFKVTHYILPAYPAASLLAGLLLDRLFARAPDTPAWLWRVPFALTTVFVAVVAVVLGAFLRRVFQTPWLDAGMLMPLALGGAAIAMSRVRLAWRARAGDDGARRRTGVGDGDPGRSRRTARAAALPADSRARRTGGRAGAPGRRRRPRRTPRRTGADLLQPTQHHVARQPRSDCRLPAPGQGAASA